MGNALDIGITTRSLLKYSLPTLASMVFMNVYMMTDGIFVARLIGTTALSAVNIILPLIMLSIALGAMFATGGSAIVARKMGEGREEEARENFSLVTLFTALCALFFAALGLAFIHPIIRFLGANDATYRFCFDYAYVTLLFFPLGVFAVLFQIFFITAGRADLGMAANMAGGVVTIALDYICIALLNMGIAGAAVSTGVGYAIPASAGLLYFLLNRRGAIHFVRPRMDLSVLVKSCTNGSSEMVTSLSQSVITILFNNILMRMAGENGVASITIILYAQGLLNSAFLGYSTGIAPLISFNYGMQGHERLKKTYSISKRVIGVSSLAVFAFALLFSGPLVAVFSPAGTAVYAMAVRGLRIFSFCFLFMGFNIFASSMFTALSDGKASAIIAFLRSLVFVAISILLLPKIFQINGVWLAVPTAEILGFLVSCYYFKKRKERYLYA